MEHYPKEIIKIIKNEIQSKTGRGLLDCIKAYSLSKERVDVALKYLKNYAPSLKMGGWGRRFEGLLDNETQIKYYIWDEDRLNDDGFRIYKLIDISCPEDTSDTIFLIQKEINEAIKSGKYQEIEITNDEIDAYYINKKFQK